MELKIDELLNKVTDHIEKMVKTETVIGDEFKLGDFSCRPVIKVGVGFGSGMGQGEDPKKKAAGTGGGAGAGIGIAPIGFLVAKGGEISFLNTDKNKGLSGLFEKVPDLMEKMMEMKKKKEEGE
ncbi:MAG TPA: spore germination protein GerW family protein [Bacteroidales bacterium]|nr:spore germination protein GerW family protein [Bacteroidales bacterium]